MTGGNKSPADPTMFSDKQIEAAAKAWLEWQFEGQTWANASIAMKKKFLEGAQVILAAVEEVPT